MGSNNNLNSIIETDEIDVIVLMAGEGKRLLPLTNDRPKALLLCDDGATIFERLLFSFTSNGQKSTFIPVIGHGKAIAQKELSRLKDKFKIHSVVNPFYRDKGPVLSLYLGLLHSRGNRVVIVNGDTLIKETLASEVRRWYQKKEIFNALIGICASKTDTFSKDDMKILLDENHFFVKAGKDIEPGAGALKSAGVICIKDKVSKYLLKETIESLLMNKTALANGYYWHNLLNELKYHATIELIKVAADSWHEVDTDFDFKFIN